jgi:MFS transporter, DHA2 family, multidrug resistance protein
VFAVLLGSINSVLAGKLLSIGLPDLRGALGIGFDEASWLPTAFNGAQMFIGPMSIALGAIFGPRRVLLVSATIFIVTSIVSPLVPDYGTLVFLQIIRGLSSGTFYPLTLGFVLRGLPQAWVPFGLAAYGLEVLGSNHIAYPLYGFYSEHLSWHWIFWNTAIFTPVMMLGIHFGMPAQKTLRSYRKLHYAGGLYISGGLTFLFVALDQGERTDWFNYGLVNGCVVVGLLLFAFGVYRRWRKPSKLFDFSFMMTRTCFFQSIF